MRIGFALLKRVGKVHEKVTFMQKLEGGGKMSSMHVGEEHFRQRVLK